MTTVEQVTALIDQYGDAIATAAFNLSGRGGQLEAVVAHTDRADEFKGEILVLLGQLVAQSERAIKLLDGFEAVGEFEDPWRTRALIGDLRRILGDD